MAPAALQQYLPRLVLEWDELAPGQNHRRIDGSMVFVDVSGFTKMSERLARHGKIGAEEVTEVINNTFDRLLAEAYAYGANLLKFGGDALLLFFEGDLHPQRAAAAASGMRQALTDIGSFETTAGKVLLRMSVGMHSGTFDFFLVGGSHREFIVAGPAVTQTTAMESAASAGQILVTPEAAARLPRRNVGRVLGPGFLLAGRVGGVEKGAIERAAKAKTDLTQFVPVGLRATLASGEAEAEHRTAAVGFIHYMHFDQMVESSPEAAAKALDSLVCNVQEAIDRRGVTFLASDAAGDGGKLILTAGVPTSTGNDEEQMLLSLREIASSQPPIPLHIGVNWGPVFAGEVGPAYRKTYTVMGDTVNLAARLMAKAGPGEIYTVREMLNGSRTTFETTALEPFLVKGKKQPIQAYVVGDPSGTRAEIAGADLPLIGRDQELEAMLATLAASSASGGRTVELAAEAGMGKTRLLEEFLARADAGRVIRADCRLYQSATPYFPFRALLRAALGLEGLDDQQTVKTLHKIIAENAPEQLPWLSLVGIPLNLAIEESPEVTQLDDQFRPFRTITAVGAVLEATVTGPTLFVVEDTHWMDEASRELLGGLLSGLERLPWMFVLTRRPGDTGFVAPKGAGTVRMELTPLRQDQAESLINTATREHPLLPQQVRALAQRAAGHPLFLVELLEALRQGGDVEELPHSVEGLIGSRIDQLPTHERNILRRVAVLGTGFQADHAVSVLPEGAASSPTRALRPLTDFVSLDQKGWVQFRHALIRDVAYEGLPYKTRQGLHLNVAESLLKSAGDHPEDQAELLSLHYFYAKQWNDAWHFSRLAGDHAKEIYANTEAARFYERAIASGRLVKDLPSVSVGAVTESLGDVLYQGGLIEEAVRAFGRAAPSFRKDPVHRAELLYKRAQTRARSGSYSLALRESSLGYKLILTDQSDAASKVKAQLVALMASLRSTQGRHREALRLAERAIEEAQRSNEQRALARAYTTLDDALEMLGHPESATYLPSALSIYEQLGDLKQVAAVTNNMGVRAVSAGRWNEAIGLYRTSHEAFLGVGDEPGAAVVAANLSEVLVSQGRLQEAEPMLEESLRVLRAHNDEFLFLTEIQWARLVMGRGDFERAAHVLREARDGAAAIGYTQFAHTAALYLALTRVRLGDPASAIAFVEETERSKVAIAEPLVPLLCWVAAVALTAIGEYEGALTRVRTGLSHAVRLGMPYEQAQLLMARSDISRRYEGKTDREDDELATELLKGLGVREPDSEAHGSSG